MSPSTRDPEFYLSHSGYVRALARHVVFDEHLAADVEQQVWLAALDHTPRDTNSPRAWLKALVRNFAIKTWLAEARRAKREEHVSRSRAPVPTPAEILEHEGARRRVVEALLEIDDPYRAVLVLRFFEELQPAEIAKRLGLPVETVRTQIKRGLERLRAKLRRDRAWSLALVHSLRLEPHSYGAVLAAATKTLIQGALPVSVAQKSIAAAVAVIAVCFLLWTRESSVAPQSAAAKVVESAELDELRNPQAPSDDALDSARTEVAHAEPVVDAAPSPNATTGSLVVRMTWSDGTPAADVQFKLLLAGRGDMNHDFALGRTVADGSAQFDELPPGGAYVYPDRGGYGNTSIRAGERAELVVELPRGADIEGIVVDELDAPIAGADIYIHTGIGMAYDGFVVGRSDARGKFTVRSIAPDSLATVSARARNRAPSAQHYVISAPGVVVKMKLVLDIAGTSLTGRVVDDEARPVSGACVFVGRDERWEHLKFSDGSTGRPACAQLVRTDDDGRFVVGGVAFEPTRVIVRAKGFAPSKNEIDVSMSRSIEVQLARGSSLSGVVRDAGGSPKERITVMVGDGYGFAGTIAVSASDGSYAAQDIALGELDVQAGGAAGDSAKTKITSTPGAQLRWDPVLVPSLTLVGRLSASDADLTGWTINAQSMDPEAEPYFNYTATDSTGRFEFRGCPDTEMRVVASPPGEVVVQAAVVEHVRPGREELVIEVDPSLVPSVFIIGRVVGPTGEPIGGARLAPEHPLMTRAPLFNSEAASGAFKLGPFAPGEWSLLVDATGFVSRRLPAHTLARGETWDVGDVRVELGGSVAVTFLREAGAEGAVTWLQLRGDDDGASEWLRPDGERAQSGQLAAGSYTLIASGAGIALSTQAVSVRTGEQTKVELSLRGGVLTKLRVRKESNAAKNERIALTIAATQRPFVWRGELPAQDDGSFLFATHLVPGAYRVTADTTAGASATLEIEVRAGEPDAVARELVLR